MVRTLRAVFRLRNCSDRRLARGGRECLQYFIHRCTAPCTAAGDGAPTTPRRCSRSSTCSPERGRRCCGFWSSGCAAPPRSCGSRRAPGCGTRSWCCASSCRNRGSLPPAEAEADVVGLAARGNLACGVFLHVREGKVLGKSHPPPHRHGGDGRRPSSCGRCCSSDACSTLRACRRAHRHGPVAPAEPDAVRSALERAAGHPVRLEIAGARRAGAPARTGGAQRPPAPRGGGAARRPQKRARVDRASMPCRRRWACRLRRTGSRGSTSATSQAAHPVASHGRLPRRARLEERLPALPDAPRRPGPTTSR